MGLAQPMRSEAKDTKMKEAANGLIGAPKATDANEGKERKPKKPADPELVAIRKVGAVTDGLTDSAKRRVLQYHSDRSAKQEAN